MAVHAIRLSLENVHKIAEFEDVSPSTIQVFADRVENAIDEWFCVYVDGGEPQTVPYFRLIESYEYDEKVQTQITRLNKRK